MYTDAKPSHFVETAMSYAAGFLYAVGFFLWVDATVVGANNDLAAGHDESILTGSSSSFHMQKHNEVHVLWYHWFPIIIGTVGIFMVNLPPHSAIFGDEGGDYIGIDFDDNYGKRVKAWLLISFIVSFASIICAIWMAIAQLLEPNNITNTYPGIILIVSTVLVFLSNITYRFQRAFETQDDNAF